MKLSTDIIVENNGVLSIIKAGTVISEVSFRGDDFWTRLEKSFIDNIEVVDDKVQEYDEEVEGQQRDVDDWDYHNSKNFDGEMIVKTMVPFPASDQAEFMEEWKQFYPDSGDQFSPKLLAKYVSEALSDGDLKKYMIEALLGQDGKPIGNFDVTITNADMDGDVITFLIGIKMQLSFVDDDPFYRGGRSYGRNYGR